MLPDMFATFCMIKSGQVMASYEEAYRCRTHAQWHIYTPETVNKSRPSLPSSSPPPYRSQSSNVVPNRQKAGPSSTPEDQGLWRPADSSVRRGYYESASRAQAGNHRPEPAPHTTRWAPHESLNREQELHRSEYNRDIWQGTPQNVSRQGPGQADHNWYPPRTIQFDSSLPTFPHMPGAARYLQQREDHNFQESRVASGSTSDLNGSNFGLRGTNWAYPGSKPLATAQPPNQLPVLTGPFVDDMNSQMTRNNHVSLKRPMEASGSLRGTQHAPLELSSSPEPETKRRKVTNFAQTARSRPSEIPTPTIYDGHSRLEITKMLTGSPFVKPDKVRYYAVAIGREPGVYLDWPSAEKQVHGFLHAKHRKFKSEEEALAYVELYREHSQVAPSTHVSQQPAQKSFDPGYYSASANYEPAQPSLQQTSPLNPDRGFVPPDNGLMQASEDGPKLVPEQQHVVDLILQGHNVFYTGSAGCGKSTILKAFVKQLQQRGRRVKIVAPTNLAALNVGGQTTWNFAGWTPDSMKMHINKLMDSSLGDKSWKKFDETDVLVIDEISMIENLLFERLNMVLKASRGEKYGGGAFGGIQMVVTGDLAPVKPFGRCMCGWELEKDNQHSPKEYTCTNRNCREHTFYDIDKWAFRSRAWEECNFRHVNLTQIHRQSDMMFKSILNRIRTDGTILKPHAKVLLNHTSETEGAIEVYARRVDVDRVNNDNIHKISSAALAYKCVDTFDWPEQHRSDTTLERNTYRLPGGSLSALKDHRFDTAVQLKLNQRVVLQANLDPAAGLVNGAQGSIIEFKDFDEKALPRAANNKTEIGELRGDHAKYREEQIKEFANSNGRQPWPVVRFTNGVVRTIFADCTVNVLGNEEPWCRLSRTQIPLAAGYAITVHKSQGMTLDRVTVDLARAFEPSQIYVALSRARSLKGLTVTALPRFDLGGANAQVKEFMENIVSEQKARMQVAH
ncbi:hypothetical protein OPT61_g936 [Boeremia exigua]|uniref:Uncharacterized protein n=1 Tax=Boeremia exigua TaxID=749465 RepID=A0ACC2IS21_9PLEO|nr:hypothetical protein OPT61_g936 [Boeremia exigua]